MLRNPRPGSWPAVARKILLRDEEGAADLLAAIGDRPAEARARLRAGGDNAHRALDFYRSVGATRFIREAKTCSPSDAQSAARMKSAYISAISSALIWPPSWYHVSTKVHIPPMPKVITDVLGTAQPLSARPASRISLKSAGVFVANADDDVAPLRAERMKLLVGDTRLEPLLGVIDDVPDDKRAEPLGGRSGRFDRLSPANQQLVHRAEGNPEQQVFLARKVVVQAPRP